MNRVRKQRLIIVVVVLAGLAVATALSVYALRRNMDLYYTPSQVVNGQAPLGRKMRIGGLVEKGSVKRNPDSLDVTFIVTDGVHHFLVHYRGILPDLFRAGKGVVASGTLVSRDRFEATDVLAKHDANYTPPVVKEAIRQGRQAEGQGRR